MSGDTSAVPPFDVVGDVDAPVCVDGLCDVRPADEPQSDDGRERSS